jgi:transcriptional regulator with XRE-family HTH domain
MIVLRKAIKDNGYTMASFAEEIGVSIATVNNWCRKGLRPRSDENVCKIESVLGKTINALYKPLKSLKKHKQKEFTDIVDAVKSNPCKSSIDVPEGFCDISTIPIIAGNLDHYINEKLVVKNNEFVVKDDALAVKNNTLTIRMGELAYSFEFPHEMNTVTVAMVNGTPSVTFSK